MFVLLYPGSFDPFTLGHLDVAQRAARLCDRLVVAVLDNRGKKASFSLGERAGMAADSLADLPNVDVVVHDGLLVDVFRRTGARAVVRGIRSESDFRLESELAAANRILEPAFETLLLPCRMDLAYISSTIVREVASLGGDISGMVPAAVRERVVRRLGGTT